MLTHNDLLARSWYRNVNAPQPVRTYVVSSIARSIAVIVMSYCFDIDEPVAAGIRRMAHEQIDEAHACLTAPDDHDLAIHEARKRLKKLRALVRLVRDEIGPDVYMRENVCFRDAGRRLSGVRDAYVLVATMDRLGPSLAIRHPGADVTGVRDWLTQRYERIARDHLAEDTDAMASVADTLATARARVETWPVTTCGFAAIREGLHRVYRRGFERMHHAQEQPSTERLHEWRKRVKYLWYHMRILAPLAPDLSETLIDPLGRLGECLGDDHDFAVLRQTLLRTPELPIDLPSYEALLLHLNERRAELQEEAWTLGAQIYREPPDAFVQRIEDYWTAWQASSVPV